MREETNEKAADAAAPEEFSAAAPPDREAPGTGETSFADAEAAPAGAVRDEDGVIDDPVEAAEVKAAEYLALAQRSQADFENYRKRMAREAAQAADRGTAKLVKELLPSLDHLDLALRHAEEEGQDGELLKGIRLVQEELVNALGRCGVQAFSPQGETFDPVEQEAMASQPAQDADPGTVIEVYQQGYRLNGAVLRPARVVVAA